MKGIRDRTESFPILSSGKTVKETPESATRSRRKGDPEGEGHITKDVEEKEIKKQ